MPAICWNTAFLVEALLPVIYLLMPLVAQTASKLAGPVFSFRWVFIDKSVFRAQGGIWHQMHRLLGIVPHPGMDTGAFWVNSD